MVPITNLQLKYTCNSYSTPHTIQTQSYQINIFVVLKSNTESCKHRRPRNLKKVQYRMEGLLCVVLSDYEHRVIDHMKTKRSASLNQEEEE